MRSERGGRFGWAMTGLLIAICACMSWLLAAATFAVRTDFGHVYEDSLSPSSVDVNEYEEYEGHVSITERDVYSRSWVGGGVLKFDVFLDLGEGRANELTLHLWAGKLREIPARHRRPGCEPSQGGAARYGYGLWWQFSGDAFDRIRALYGSDAATGCRVLVAYEGATAWAPYARDATVSVPRGGMIPLMGMLLERSVEGLGGSMDQDAGDAMARRLVDEITTGLDYARLEDVVDRVAYEFGPVQFLTLSTTYMTVLLLVVSLKTGWARGAAGITMNLIPYIGFFGTLLGMGSALGVLGEANLSDPVSKATNLGPIGSRLALAIETTKYALVCFGVVSVAVLLRDAMVGRGADEGET